MANLHSLLPQSFPVHPRTLMGRICGNSDSMRAVSSRLLERGATMTWHC